MEELYYISDIKNQFNLCASDEVGRGCLAGPVTACTVSFSGNLNDLLNLLDELKKLKITDSKKLTSKKRQNILKILNINIAQIHTNRIYKIFNNLKFSINQQSIKTIDRINILQSSLLAMRKSFDLVKDSELSKIWLIDGNQKPEQKDEIIYTIIKGDKKSILIGLASIIAKEHRDYLMKKYALKYPKYGFDQHYGYGTKLHRSAIKEFGILPIHRKSFKLF